MHDGGPKLPISKKININPNLYRKCLKQAKFRTAAETPKCGHKKIFDNHQIEASSTDLQKTCH